MSYTAPLLTPIHQPETTQLRWSWYEAPKLNSMLRPSLGHHHPNPASTTPFHQSLIVIIHAPFHHNSCLQVSASIRAPNPKPLALPQHKQNTSTIAKTLLTAFCLSLSVSISLSSKLKPGNTSSTSFHQTPTSPWMFQPPHKPPTHKKKVLQSRVSKNNSSVKWHSSGGRKEGRDVDSRSSLEEEAAVMRASMYRVGGRGHEMRA